MISCIKKDFRIVSFAHLLKDHRCEFMEPETKHLFNAETFSKVKPGVVLINTSRGALVDSEALLSALRDGQVGAAGLDVYEEESEWFYEDRSEVTRQNRTLSLLVSMPNVIVTSHQAFLTREALANIATTTLANLDAYFMVSIFEPYHIVSVSNDRYDGYDM